MKILHNGLPVKLKFCGRPKRFDAQEFDIELEKFRKKAYSTIPDENNSPRARCIIDSAIVATMALLENIWNTPEKLVWVTRPSIHVYLEVDNDYTAYRVTVSTCADSLKYEISKSDNFDLAKEAEEEAVLRKYGFVEVQPKQYRVRFGNYEAVLNAYQLAELRKEQPDWCYNVEPIIEK